MVLDVGFDWFDPTLYFFFQCIPDGPQSQLFGDKDTPTF